MYDSSDTASYHMNRRYLHDGPCLAPHRRAHFTAGRRRLVWRAVDHGFQTPSGTGGTPAPGEPLSEAAVSPTGTTPSTSFIRSIGSDANVRVTCACSPPLEALSLTPLRAMQIDLWSFLAGAGIALAGMLVATLAYHLNATRAARSASRADTQDSLPPPSEKRPAVSEG